MNYRNQIQKLLTALLLVAFVFIARAQSFTRIYQQDRPTMLFSSVLLNDTVFVVSNNISAYSPPYFNQFAVSEIASDGNFLRYKIMHENISKEHGAFANSLTYTSDGRIAYCGYSRDSVRSVFFARFNKNIDSIEFFEYPSPSSYAFQGEVILEYSPGVFYIAGMRSDKSTTRGNVLLIKIDSAGNRLWEKYYGGANEHEFARSLIKLKNGNLMIGSGSRDLGRPIEKAYTWLIELDTAGNLVRQWYDKDSTYTAYGLHQTADGGFIYAAQKKLLQTINSAYYTATIVKVDSLFKKEWIIEEGVITSFTGIVDLEELPDGNFIGCGNKPIYRMDSTMISGWIIKFTPAGEIIWSKQYAGLNQSNVWQFLYDIDPLPDGGFVACGEIMNSPEGQQGWLLRVDSNGCEIENCLVGIEEPRANTLTVQLYPNPTNAQVEVSMQGYHAKEATFTIYNLLSQPVYARTESNLSHTYTKLLDLSYLANGIYFIEVMVDGERIVRQVVKQ